jgi:hypothetical protein
MYQFHKPRFVGRKFREFNYVNTTGKGDSTTKYTCTPSNAKETGKATHYKAICTR